MLGAAGSALAFIIAGATPASTADMPLKSPAAVVAYNWSGFYVGVNAGYAWGDFDTATNNPGPPVFVPTSLLQSQFAAIASPHLKANGFTGGGQVGYNWQFGSYVFGMEADFNALLLKKTAATSGTPPGAAVRLDSTTSVSTDWIATVRPRFGYTFERTLAYVTGGLAVTRFEYSQFNNYVVSFSEQASIAKTHLGWTVGGGLEHALTKSLTAKLEYLYVDMGNHGTTAPGSNSLGNCPTAATCLHSHEVNLSAHLLRAGVNYRF